jgi:predicted HTH domain antitoxin
MGSGAIAYYKKKLKPHPTEMQITVEIPDSIVQQLEQTPENLSHRLLELIVADAYRCGKISTAEVGRILQIPTRLETHQFLKQMGTYLNYDAIELEQDLQTLKEFRAQ